MIINVATNTVIIVISEMRINASGTSFSTQAKNRSSRVPDSYTPAPALKKFFKLPEKSGLPVTKRYTRQSTAKAVKHEAAMTGPWFIS